MKTKNTQHKCQHCPSDFGCEYAAEKGCVCLDSKNGGEIYFIWFWIFRRNAVFCWGLLLKTKHKRRKNENKMSTTEKQKQYQVSEDGGVWTIKTSTTLKTMELKFKVFIFNFLHQFYIHLNHAKECRTCLINPFPLLIDIIQGSKLFWRSCSLCAMC